MLTNALCTRFEMGLMVELTPPDLDIRLGILKKLASESDLKFEQDALLYIAKNFENNVRELEGAFNKVCAYAEVTNQALTLKLTKEVLKCKEEDSGISFEKIAKFTAEYYDVNYNELLGSSRAQKVSEARHMAVYLSREITNMSFVNIADFYGKKYTTMMYSHDKIKSEISIKSELSTAAREIRQALKLN